MIKPCQIGPDPPSAGPGSRDPARRPGPRDAALLLGQAAALVLVAGCMMFPDHRDGGHVPSARVKHGPITIKITETGELRAGDQVTISAVNDKQILWLCPEGKFVNPGDTLIVFESEKYIISRGEAQSSLQVAQADLEKARNNLEAQRTKEKSAKQKYQSLPALAKQGFVMESEVEEARLAYQELRSVTKSFQAGVDAAQANVDRAKSAVEQEERKLRLGVMLAPRAGLVVYATAGSAEEAKKIAVGMVPFEGMDLMYLPDVTRMLVDTQIGEVDLSKVKVGQPALVQLDAYPGVNFRGEIQTIANLAKRKINRATGKATGAKVFDVTVRVLDQDPRLRPGLSASVDIIVNQFAEAIYVPLEAVSYDENERPFVYVKRGGGVRTRAIEVVGSNDRVAVVNKNLKPNEEVLLGRPSSP